MNKEELEKELAELKEKEKQINAELAKYNEPKHTELIGKWFHTSFLGYEYVIHIKSIRCQANGEIAFGDAWELRYYKIGDVVYTHTVNGKINIAALLEPVGITYKEITEQEARKKYIPGMKSYID